MTTPPQQQLTSLTAVVIDWIKTLGWDDREELGYPLAEGPRIKEAPDKIVHVTGAGGPGYVTEEGSVDAANFQFRVRGPANAPDQAQLAADNLDTLVLTAPFPAIVDGVKIQHVHRLGGRPVPMPVLPGDLRHEFTATYTVILGVF